jgi:hypothetical protein
MHAFIPTRIISISIPCRSQLFPLILFFHLLLPSPLLTSPHLSSPLFSSFHRFAICVRPPTHICVSSSCRASLSSPNDTRPLPPGTVDRSSPLFLKHSYLSVFILFILSSSFCHPTSHFPFHNNNVDVTRSMSFFLQPVFIPVFSALFSSAVVSISLYWCFFSSLVPLVPGTST